MSWFPNIDLWDCDCALLCNSFRYFVMIEMCINMIRKKNDRHHKIWLCSNWWDAFFSSGPHFFIFLIGMKRKGNYQLDVYLKFWCKKQYYFSESLWVFLRIVISFKRIYTLLEKTNQRQWYHIASFVQDQQFIPILVRSSAHSVNYWITISVKKYVINLRTKWFSDLIFSTYVSFLKVENETIEPKKWSTLLVKKMR